MRKKTPYSLNIGERKIIVNEWMWKSTHIDEWRCFILYFFKRHLHYHSAFQRASRLSSSNIFLLNTTCFGSCPVHVWYPTILLWYPTIVFFFNLLFISLMYLLVSFPSNVILERWKYGTKNDKYDVCICTEHMVYGDINVSHPMYWYVPKKHSNL